jgi:hypothetical protein
VSNADTSAYLLIAAGLVWIIFGIMGLRINRHRDDSDQHAPR